ncbi:MAG: transposase [Pirellulaceae bacterium]|nr:transposase [Pirellulaceae bacterium]
MSYISNLVHFVWSTAKREPLIRKSWQDQLYAYMGGILANKKGKLLAAGGLADHVHVYASLPATLTLADAAGALSRIPVGGFTTMLLNVRVLTGKRDTRLLVSASQPSGGSLPTFRIRKNIISDCGSKRSRCSCSTNTELSMRKGICGFEYFPKSKVRRTDMQ